MQVQKEAGEITKELYETKDLLSKLISDGYDKSGSMKDLYNILNSQSFKAVKNIFECLFVAFRSKMNLHDSLEASKKGTLAAFAIYNGTAQNRDVIIKQTNEGLGFNILGGKEQNTPIFISKIIPGGAAEQCSSLMRGDKLIKINDKNVEKEKHETVVEMLKECTDIVYLTVRYCPKDIIA